MDRLKFKRYLHWTNWYFGLAWNKYQFMIMLGPVFLLWNWDYPMYSSVGSAMEPFAKWQVEWSGDSIEVAE